MQQNCSTRNASICDQPVSFDDFKVLASSNFELHLKIKEILLISQDQPIFIIVEYNFVMLCKKRQEMSSDQVFLFVFQALEIPPKI